MQSDPWTRQSKQDSSMNATERKDLRIKVEITIWMELGMR